MRVHASCHELSSHATAAFVSAESLNVVGAFDDGAFMLLAGESRTLTLVARAPFGKGEFEVGLGARSAHCETRMTSRKDQDD